MPIYDYECGSCGVFTEMRPMSQSDMPCDCPECGAESPRVFIAMPALASMDGSARRAQAINEESRHRPKSREEFAAAKTHRLGCKCCSGGKRQTAFRAEGVKAAANARPWMISH